MEIARSSPKPKPLRTRAHGCSINNTLRCLIFLEARERFNHFEIFLLPRRRESPPRDAVQCAQTLSIFTRVSVSERANSIHVVGSRQDLY